MARLYVLGGPDLGRTHELRSGDVAGRGADCALVLRHPSVSRRHARFEREDAPEGERWSVADAGSTNGLFVAGERVERAGLEDGAVFRLGELELRFRLAPEPAEPAQPPERRPPPPAAPPPRVDEPDEFELEMPDEPLARADDARPSPFVALQHAGSPPAPRTRSAAAETLAPASSSGSARPRPALPAHPVPARGGGLFSSDLAQQPALVRAVVLLLALALFGALAFGAWRATLLLRERVASPPPLEEPDAR